MVLFRTAARSVFVWYSPIYRLAPYARYSPILAARFRISVLFSDTARSALRYSPDPRLALFIRYFLHSEAHSFTIGTIFCHGSLLLHDAFQWCGSLPPIGTLPQTGSLSSCGALYSDGSLSSCGALYSDGSLSSC